MNTATGRWSLVTALLVSGLGLSGCTNAAGHPGTAPVSSAPVTSASPGTAIGPVQGQAIAATRLLRSYAFQAIQTLTGGPVATVTTVTGRVVLPTSIDYTVAVGGKREEVIRVLNVTFVRSIPGPWKRLRRPPRAPDPLRSLLSILSALTNATASAGPGGAQTLSGQLSAAAAHVAGLSPAATGPPVSVNVTLDAAHRITALSAQLQVSAAGHALTVTDVTRFSDFDAVAAIAPPL
jgi:hypothetical protein